MLERRVVGMKSERNKSLEAAGFVLQRAQAQKMIHAIFVVFDVPVEHGRIRLEPNLVRQLGGFQPLAAVNFVVADHMAHAIGKNLRPAPGQRVYA